MIRLSKKYIPAIFALTIILAYSLLLPFTGFYWDDWHWAWITQFQGPQFQAPEFVSYLRPHG